MQGEIGEFVGVILLKNSNFSKRNFFYGKIKCVKWKSRSQKETNGQKFKNKNLILPILPNFSTLTVHCSKYFSCYMLQKCWVDYGYEDV